MSQDGVLVHNTNCEVFRVQGGESKKEGGLGRSKPLIHIDSNGNVKIKEKTLNISLGNSDHAKYYLKERRPGAVIVSFEIPKWLQDFIEETSIPQTGSTSNIMNQGGLAPKLTDSTTPGTSYELPPIWAKWLEENAIPGTGKVIREGN